MPDQRANALSYIKENEKRFLEKLKEVVAIPSVSTAPEHKGDIQKTAKWIQKELLALGMEHVKIYPTPRHPIVYGDWLKAGPNVPTALIYGHYDVQPETPLDKWHTEPFTPTIKGENIYGRGTTDMKGQIIATLAAVEAIIQGGEFPINIKFLIEGEEEVGGPNLENFIAAHTDLLACDFALNPDTGMLAPDTPTITYALRGLAYFDLEIYGPQQDLHSGLFGGVVHNPAQVLAELIAGMHDAQGRVTLSGFYDRVTPLEDEERAELSRLPLNEKFYLQESGAPTLWGEEGYTPAERTGARPTLEINGIYSGFIEKGSKTVLPAYAMAKISTRLVPRQDPSEVGEQLRAYLTENAPPTITWKLEQTAGSVASISDRKSPWIKAYVEAAQSAWGKRPIFKREGGSVPVVVHFQKLLGVDSVNIGFGLPSDNMHGPNEKLHLPTFYKGIEALVHFFFNVKSKQ